MAVVELVVREHPRGDCGELCLAAAAGGVAVAALVAAAEPPRDAQRGGAEKGSLLLPRRPLASRRLALGRSTCLHHLHEARQARRVARQTRRCVYHEEANSFRVFRQQARHSALRHALQVQDTARRTLGRDVAPSSVHAGGDAEETLSCEGSVCGENKAQRRSVGAIRG